MAYGHDDSTINIVLVLLLLLLLLLLLSELKQRAYSVANVFLGSVATQLR